MSLSDLTPGRQSPLPIRFEEVNGGSAPELLRDMYCRLGAPHGWSNQHWSEKQWHEWLTAENRHRWLIFVNDEAIGLFNIEMHGDGDVELCIFGLAPEWVKGFGGNALTLGTQLVHPRVSRSRVV
jgi:hypothetical protein